MRSCNVKCTPHIPSTASAHGHRLTTFSSFPSTFPGMKARQGSAAASATTFAAGPSISAIVPATTVTASFSADPPPQLAAENSGDAVVCVASPPRSPELAAGKVGLRKSLEVHNPPSAGSTPRRSSHHSRRTSRVAPSCDGDDSGGEMVPSLDASPALPLKFTSLPSLDPAFHRAGSRPALDR